jgi:hypothetical protein
MHNLSINGINWVSDNLLSDLTERLRNAAESRKGGIRVNSQDVP